MYVSPVDLLGISLDELMGLDKINVIKLEKLLDAKFAFGETQGYNQQGFNKILDQLNNPETRKAIYFVERHPLLKEFITNGTHHHVKTFSIDSDLLAATPEIDHFLEPYFEQFLFPFIKKELQKKRYDIILRAMKYKALFTPIFLDKYYNLILNKLDLVLETMKNVPTGKLYKRLPEVTYGTFAELLNTVPIGLIRKPKIEYVNLMVDYYNRAKNKYPEFTAIQRAFRGMERLDFDDFEMKRFVKKLSKQIQNVEAVENNGELSVGKAIWIVLILVVFGFRFIRSINSSQTTYPNETKTEYIDILRNIENNEQGRNVENYLERLYMRDAPKNAFFEQLIKSSKNKADVGIPLNLHNRSNPYSNYFNDFLKVPKTTKTIDFYNRQESSVLLFKLNKWRGDDKAGFFKKNSYLKMDIAIGDSLVFFKGKLFGELLTANVDTIPKKTLDFVVDKIFKLSTEQEQKLLGTYYVIDSIGKEPIILVKSSGISFQDLKYRELH